MDIDTGAVDEVVLALLYLNLCEKFRMGGNESPA